jgi:hypothetical protein
MILLVAYDSSRRGPRCTTTTTTTTNMNDVTRVRLLYHGIVGIKALRNRQDTTCTKSGIPGKADRPRVLMTPLLRCGDDKYCKINQVKISSRCFWLSWEGAAHVAAGKRWNSWHPVLLVPWLVGKWVRYAGARQFLLNRWNVCQDVRTKLFYELQQLNTLFYESSSLVDMRCSYLSFLFK